MYLSTRQLLPVLLYPLKMLFGICNVGRLANLVAVLPERERVEIRGDELLYKEVHVHQQHIQIAMTKLQEVSHFQ